MRRVFLSFLGIGSKREHGYFYDLARYTLDGNPSDATEFVQVAEIQLLGPQVFDQVIIVATPKSYELHYSNLQAQLKGLGVERIAPVIIQEEMSAEGQWSWFEQILEYILPGDCLTVDLTHGYRAIPIVFSTAINFLQKARRIKLDGVYYGAYEKDRSLSPIIDMKEFYLIGEWAEAVSRLVEDADARKMAAMGREAPAFQARELAAEDLIASCENLTNTIRNVDIHNVLHAASVALERISLSLPNASPMEKILLQLIVEKFSCLVPPVAPGGRYDSIYFQNQLEIARLLQEHKLYMQAFTVMREMIASIGLITNEKAKPQHSDRQKFRRKADVFLNMLQHDESKWDFDEKTQPIVDGLLPFFDDMKWLGVVPFIRGFLPDLLKCRNGFDHAWTGRREALTDLDDRASEFLNNFRKVFDMIESAGIFTR